MNRKIKFFSVALLASLLTLSACGPTTNPSDPNGDTPTSFVDAVGIAISSQDNIRTIKTGETLQLTAVVYPEGANQKVIWSSSDETIATVTNGLVSAIKEGSVNIVATSETNSNITASFALIVERGAAVQVVPTAITVSSRSGSVDVKAGQTLALSVAVTPENASRNVTWSSSDETIATVTNGTVKGITEGSVTITATSEVDTTVSGSITINVLKADEPVIDKSFDEMDYTTHEYYVTCDNDAKLKIKGTVLNVGPEKDGKVNVFIQNGVDGYYIYNLDAVSFPVEEGKSYEIGGYKKYYNGLCEIVNVAHYKALDEVIEYTVNPLGDLNPMDRDATLHLHGSLISGEGIIESAETSTSSYSFYATVNGTSTTFRVDTTQATAEEVAEINSLLAINPAGSKFTFKAFLTAFGYGKPANQLSVTRADFLTFAKMSDQELVNAASKLINVKTTIAQDETTIDLPKTIEGFDGITVSWASDNTAIDATTGAVTHANEDVKVNLTATAKLNDATASVTFEVNVLKIDNATYEVLHTFNCEDATPDDGSNNGNSPSKPNYAGGTVVLGTPARTWYLDNALISNIANDKVDGLFGIRMKKGGKVEIQHDDEYNVIDLDAAVYGKDKEGFEIRVDYSTDGGATWTEGTTVYSLLNQPLETYRFYLPEGVKRIAIVGLPTNGNRCNIDNIKLMK